MEIPFGIYGPSGVTVPNFSRRISFPEANTNTQGILHGIWQADSAISTSDRRLKRNIAPLQTQLRKRQEEVRGSTTTGASRKAAQNLRGGKDDDGESTIAWVLRELRPVSFSFKASKEGKAVGPTGPRYGFIAQEVEKVVPDVVRETGLPGDDGQQTKQLVYQDLIALLTLALKNQQGRIDMQGSTVLDVQQEVELLLEQADLLEQTLDSIEAEEVLAL